MTEILVHGLVAGCRYALLAFGFGLVYFTTGIFHFAHGAIYAAAAYACWWLASHGWPLAAAVPAAVAFAAGLGWAVEVGLYRPLRARRAPMDVLFLTSLGGYTAGVNLLALCFGQETQSLALNAGSLVLRAGRDGAPPLVVTGVELATVVVSIALFAVTWAVLTQTKFGLAIRAYAANPSLAEAVGIDSRRLLPGVVALGSALGAVAALCVAADTGLSPAMGLDAVVSGAVAVVVGGLGSLAGTAVGGLLLGTLRYAAAWRFEARWEDVITFGLLLVVLLARPRGLFGRRTG